MTDYSKGQIYKIVDKDFNKCYIGSTVQLLCKRMSGHRRGYKQYLNGKTNYVAVYSMFDEYGIDNCKIVWIEDYPCSSKKELEAREGEMQKTFDCINRRIEGRTRKEYCEDNKEYLQERSKQHREEHKEEKKIIDKEYYDKHKDEICERIRQQRKDDPEKFKERDKQAYPKKKLMRQRPFECICGVVCKFSSRLSHFQSQKHQQYIQSLEQNNPQE